MWRGHDQGSGRGHDQGSGRRKQEQRPKTLLNLIIFFINDIFLTVKKVGGGGGCSRAAPLPSSSPGSQLLHYSWPPGATKGDLPSGGSGKEAGRRSITPSLGRGLTLGGGRR